MLTEMIYEPWGYSDSSEIKLACISNQSKNCLQDFMN